MEPNPTQKNIRTIENVIIYDYMKNNNKNAMFVRYVNESDVINALTNQRKSVQRVQQYKNDCGQNNSFQIVTHYTHICNQYFEGTFPEKIKTAKVIPLYKIVLISVSQTTGLYHYCLSSRRY